jgi:exo-beta-1,3-glucanase (GH17 family)
MNLRVGARWLLAAVAPISILFSGCLLGLAYGPNRDGQSPGGHQPATTEIVEDLAQLKTITTRLRTYTSSGTGNEIARAAAAQGMSVMAGVYLGGDATSREREVNDAIALAVEGHVTSIVVGNEMVLGGVMTPSELTAYIRRVQASVPESVLVTAAEPWHVWIDHPSLAAEVDFVAIHVHPYWEGIPIDRAVTYVMERYEQVAAIADGKKVVIAETGWPSGEHGGEQNGASSATEQNQQIFLAEFLVAARARGAEHYLFSAYDEEWKWTEGFLPAPDLAGIRRRDFTGRFAGASWGILRSDGTLKPGLVTLFPGAAPHPTRGSRIILDDRGLAAFYDIGVDTSGNRHDWLTRTSSGAMRMAYPAGQDWGAVFITVGEPVEPPRPYRDFSAFRAVRVDLRGMNGGESLDIGLKDAEDADDGTEDKRAVTNLTTDWRTYEFDLDSFDGLQLERLYVVLEFVFEGAGAQTVEFRNVVFVR